MAKNKSGRSEKKTDFWGNKYTQYYDKSGNKSGKSEQKTSWSGKKYNQHYDREGKKSRWNEQKESFFGKKYTQHYNKDNKKTGWSEKVGRTFRNDYRQYYDNNNEKSARSENKKDFWGRNYTQYYDKDGNETYQKANKGGFFSNGFKQYSKSENGSSNSKSSYSAGGGYDSSSSSRFGGFVILIIGVGVIIGLVVVGSSIFNGIKQFTQQAYNQPKTYNNNSKINIYHGTIGKKYNIEVSVSQNGNDLSGTYFYTKYKIPIQLKGQISGNRVTIYGYENNNLVDTFHGEIKANHEIIGDYRRQKDQKMMPFKLKFIKFTY
ncbi:MAG TPA: hypothetical protein VF599_03230 [Pyrinomonadaceae bacterium]|jgi:hypothetical protein